MGYKSFFVDFVELSMAEGTNSRRKDRDGEKDIPDFTAVQQERIDHLVSSKLEGAKVAESTEQRNSLIGNRSGHPNITS